MGAPEDMANTATRLFDRDEVQGVLNGSFYNPTSVACPRGPTSGTIASARDAKDKPTHYKVICISMYNGTLAKLDDMVTELKRRGYTKANRSALLRHALDLIDLDAVPRGL